METIQGDQNPWLLYPKFCLSVSAFLDNFLTLGTKNRGFCFDLYFLDFGHQKACMTSVSYKFKKGDCKPWPSIPKIPSYTKGLYTPSEKRACNSAYACRDGKVLVVTKNRTLPFSKACPNPPQKWAKTSI